MLAPCSARKREQGSRTPHKGNPKTQVPQTGTWGTLRVFIVLAQSLRGRPVKVLGQLPTRQLGGDLEPVVAKKTKDPPSQTEGAPAVRLCKRFS
jgi:hypothetical protein